MDTITSLWEIPELPFIYTPLPQPTNGGGLPDHLPFLIGVDKSTGRLLQQTQISVRDALEKVYKMGSMLSGQMDEEGIGRTYTDGFLDFIRSAEVMPDLKGKRVLEIGCGTGYLLYRMKELGAEVLGVEPGVHGQQQYEAKGVPIIHEFFPTDHVTGHFDAIVIFGVLEHVEDPTGFLQSLRSYLEDDGKVIIAVPDNEPCMEMGDISMLIHEHWSYFTRTTLHNTILKSGLCQTHIVKAAFGDVLYAAVGKQRNRRTQEELDGVTKQMEAAIRFVDKAKSATSKLVDYVDEKRGRNRSLGIYVPARAINSLVTGDASMQHCRFFDDNVLLHNTYFPGVPIPVESKENLIKAPVDDILVMSHSFGEHIVLQLQPLVPESTLFTTIRGLLE